MAGFAPATSFDRIRYCGGTASSRAGADEWDNTLAVAPEQIVLYLADGQRVKIDPDLVTNLSYGQEAHRELATLVDLGIIVAPLPLLGLLYKTRQHFIGIEYHTAGGEKAGLLIQAHKDNYRAVLQALRGATHAPITVAEADRPYIASAIGDDGLQPAPPAPANKPASPGAAPAIAPEPAPAAAAPAPASARRLLLRQHPPASPEKAPAPSGSTDPASTPRPARAISGKRHHPPVTTPRRQHLHQRQLRGPDPGHAPPRPRQATIRLSLDGTRTGRRISRSWKAPRSPCRSPSRMNELLPGFITFRIADFGLRTAD